MTQRVYTLTNRPTQANSVTLIRVSLPVAVSMAALEAKIAGISVPFGDSGLWVGALRYESSDLRGLLWPNSAGQLGEYVAPGGQSFIPGVDFLPGVGAISHDRGAHAHELRFYILSANPMPPPSGLVAPILETRFDNRGVLYERDAQGNEWSAQRQGVGLAVLPFLLYSAAFATLFAAIERIICSMTGRCLLGRWDASSVVGGGLFGAFNQAMNNTKETASSLAKLFFWGSVGVLAVNLAPAFGAGADAVANAQKRAENKRRRQERSS